MSLTGHFLSKSLVFAGLAFSGQSGETAQPPVPPKREASTELVIMLHPSMLEHALLQCSRPAPAFDKDSGWTPAQTQIVRLEEALRRKLETIDPSMKA